MFQLEKVLGLTVDSNSGFGSSPKTSLYAYVAGSTVVISNISNNQQQHIINQSKKPIKSLTFSNCGKYLVICEHGQNSAIKIWNIDTGNLYQIGEISPHEHGTKSFAISPDGNCLVTVGYNSTINLWDWQRKSKVTASKTSSEIAGISFQEDGRYFVTVGKAHFYYWYFDNASLAGKSAAIDGIEDVLFSDVACGKGKCSQYTYVVTRNGTLVIFNDQRAVEQLVGLEIGFSSIVVNEKFVFVGCQDAIIVCFDSVTLDILYVLPKCHHLGADVNAQQFSGNMSKDLKYPDTIALTLNEVTNTLGAIYNDHSIYIWNLQDGYESVTKSQASLYHSNCIWDVKMALSSEDDFITCSSDNTIRFWNMENINSTKIIYVDENYSHLKDTPITKNGEFGVRCMAISSDKNNFACGDRQGVIRVYNLPNMDLSLKLKGHDLEVLALDYTPYESAYNLLASGGKDKQIFIFDVNKNYLLIEKIVDHISSITTVKFGMNSRGQLLLISSSSDGTCRVRSIQFIDKKFLFNIEYTVSLKRVLYAVELDRQMKYLLMACQSLKIVDIDMQDIIKSLRPNSKGGFIFKTAVDPLNRYICASCLDKSIIVYDFHTGKCVSTLFSNLVTNLCFTPDSQKIIAVAGDGCIFIWKVVLEIQRLDSIDEDLLPIWAKKAPSKSADIVLSTKSVIPKGKWADRMEKTISIKTAYTSDDSEAGSSTPLSSHSDKSRAFEEFAMMKIGANSQSSPNFSRDSSLEPNDVQPVAPPRRKTRKANVIKDTANISMPKNAPNITTAKKDVIAFGVTKPRELSKAPTSKNLDNSTEKREKVSQLIGQVKQKLDAIGQEGRLKASKSMFDLSKPPPKGSWLLTYRTSVGEQKKQLQKGKSMTNLAITKFHFNEKVNQSGSDGESKPKSKSSISGNAARYTKKPVNPTDKSSSNRPKRPSLTLPKVDQLSRTQTDPEITIRRKVNKEFDEDEIRFKNKPSNLEISNVNEDQRIIQASRKLPSSPKLKVRSQLSLIRSPVLSRTQTDPEIIVRKKLQNKTSLIKTQHQHLSISSTELNRDDNFEDINVSTAKITERLCEVVASELVNTAEKAVSLYRQFINSNNQSAAATNAVENLALSLVWAQIKLERLNMQSQR